MKINFKDHGDDILEPVAADDASSDALAIARKLARNVARNSALTRRIATRAYPFKCCVVCGLQLGASLEAAHLDHRRLNNDPDNLAWLCPTHHGMYDRGLYPVAAVKMMRDHWQVTEGRPCHKARMKDAGSKAAETKRRNALSKTAPVGVQEFPFA